MKDQKGVAATENVISQMGRWSVMGPLGGSTLPWMDLVFRYATPLG